MYNFICRPTVVGILTGIYDAWDFALRIRCPEGSKAVGIGQITSEQNSAILLQNQNSKAGAVPHHRPTPAVSTRQQEPAPAVSSPRQDPSFVVSAPQHSSAPAPSRPQPGHDLLRLVVDGGFRFCDYSKFIDVLPNEAKAEAVSNGMAQKLGDELHDLCLTAMLSEAKDRADTLYRFLLYAFGVGACAIDHIERPEVLRIRSYYQSVQREGSLLFGFPGFVRFPGPLTDIHVARIQPKNDVLDLIARHFVNQRPQDIFLICDETHCTYVLHIPGLPLRRGHKKIFPKTPTERLHMADPAETIAELVTCAFDTPAGTSANIALHLLRGA